MLVSLSCLISQRYLFRPPVASAPRTASNGSVGKTETRRAVTSGHAGTQRPATARTMTATATAPRAAAPAGSQVDAKVSFFC